MLGLMVILYGQSLSFFEQSLIYIVKTFTHRIAYIFQLYIPHVFGQLCYYGLVTEIFFHIKKIQK